MKVLQLDKVVDTAVQRQGVVETVQTTVEVRSCSSSTRWPSSVMAAWRWGRRFHCRFFALRPHGR